MNISKIKLWWCLFTGGGTKVTDYILDVANNAVNALETTTKDRVYEVFATVKNILNVARACAWLVPSKWRTAFGITISALADVQMACEDLKITPEELSQVVTAWQKAYSYWRAE